MSNNPKIFFKSKSYFIFLLLLFICLFIFWFSFFPLFSPWRAAAPRGPHISLLKPLSSLETQRTGPGGKGWGLQMTPPFPTQTAKWKMLNLTLCMWLLLPPQRKTAPSLFPLVLFSSICFFPQSVLSSHCPPPPRFLSLLGEACPLTHVVLTVDLCWFVRVGRDGCPPWFAVAQRSAAV